MFSIIWLLLLRGLPKRLLGRRLFTRYALGVDHSSRRFHWNDVLMKFK